MLQSFDNSTPSQQARTDWLALLARAPLDLLQSQLAQAPTSWSWLREPETGLMMVQGRVGGTGERFNVGEVTVTRCALRLQVDGGQASVGLGYVLGRSHALSGWVALADAMLQQDAYRDPLERSLLEPLRTLAQQAKAQAHALAQSTKVDFFTVARESDAAAEDSE